MADDPKTSIGSAIGAIASLIPYVGQVAAFLPALQTLTGFVTDTINNYRRAGELTEQERNDFLQQVKDLKKDPAWQTDAERAAGGTG
jgi:hypothetical protein